MHFRAILTSALCLSPLLGQESITYTIGVSGFVPKVWTRTATERQGGKLVYLNQRALWRSDYQPFPAIAGGLLANVQVNKNKLSWGVGYEFHYDYHSFSYENSILGTNDSLSVKIQNHAIYAHARAYLRHNYRPSIFAGAKAGFLLTAAGIAEQLSGTSFSLGAGEGDKFKAIDNSSFSPSIFAAFHLGVKVYLVPRTLKKFKVGMEALMEITGATPSAKSGKYLLNASESGVTSEDNSVAYRINYTGLRAQFNVFLEIPRKEERFRRRAKKQSRKKEPPPSEERLEN